MISPGQTVGPFFHLGMAWPSGALLVTPDTEGAVVLTGIVRDGAGAPVPDAVIEIRQADGHGVIPTVEGSRTRPGAFTGFGRAATDADGRYRFTTVRPGSASGAAPFIAVTVFARGLLNALFTRIYLDPDGPPASLDPRARATLVAVGTDDELTFDIHLQGPNQTAFLTFPRHSA